MDLKGIQEEWALTTCLLGWNLYLVYLKLRTT